MAHYLFTTKLKLNNFPIREQAYTLGRVFLLRGASRGIVGMKWWRTASPRPEAKGAQDRWQPISGGQCQRQRRACLLVQILTPGGRVPAG